MKFFRIIFQSFFLTVHVVVVILFLLAAYSDRISPETFTLGAYLGLGFPIFCILNLCLTAYWLLRRSGVLLGSACFRFCYAGGR